MVLVCRSHWTDAINSGVEFNAARIFSLQRDKICYLARIALVAQLVEHLICNQGVTSSNLVGGTIFP